jgi:polar amino acid transport system substrate-binding protein
VRPDIPADRLTSQSPPGVIIPARTGGFPMRRILPAVAIAATATMLAACGSSGAGSGSGGGGSAASPSTSASAAPAACSPAGLAAKHELFQNGVLTVGTDSPVYTPWFVGNNPKNGKGYESAVAFSIAKHLGFSPSQVTWVREPFNNSYAPGPKKFDFDINEISFTPARATAVTFSKSYYDVDQALIALKGTPIVTKHSPSDLPGYVYGDQIGTTSLAFINSAIKPTARPKVFQTLNDAKQALQTHQIAALVADTPTAQFISSSEIKGSVVVGQFPSSGEHFGLVFAKGNPLVTCVNQALDTMKSDGTFDQLEKKWLKVYTTIPSLQP